MQIRQLIKAYILNSHWILFLVTGCFGYGCTFVFFSVQNAYYVCMYKYVHMFVRLPLFHSFTWQRSLYELNTIRILIECAFEEFVVLLSTNYSYSLARLSITATVNDTHYISCTCPSWMPLASPETYSYSCPKKCFDSQKLLHFFCDKYIIFIDIY